jgi:hypothetical protein
MSNPFWRFIFEVVGAFVCWAFGGFKGKLEDEMSGPYEVSKKSTRNTVISGIVVLIIYLLLKK